MEGIIWLFQEGAYVGRIVDTIVRYLCVGDD